MNTVPQTQSTTIMNNVSIHPDETYHCKLMDSWGNGFKSQTLCENHSRSSKYSYNTKYTVQGARERRLYLASSPMKSKCEILSSLDSILSTVIEERISANSRLQRRRPTSGMANICRGNDLSNQAVYGEEPVESNIDAYDKTRPILPILQTQIAYDAPSQKRGNKMRSFTEVTRENSIRYAANLEKFNALSSSTNR